MNGCAHVCQCYFQSQRHASQTQALSPGCDWAPIIQCSWWIFPNNSTRLAGITNISNHDEFLSKQSKHPDRLTSDILRNRTKIASEMVLSCSFKLKFWRLTWRQKPPLNFRDLKNTQKHTKPAESEKRLLQRLYWMQDPPGSPSSLRQSHQQPPLWPSATGEANVKSAASIGFGVIGNFWLKLSASLPS